MSQLMEIPDPVYSALEKAAQAQGTTPIGWIASQLAKECLTGDQVPLPPGLQHVRLSLTEAQKIRAILDDATVPTAAGKNLPKADASVLLK